MTEPLVAKACRAIIVALVGMLFVGWLYLAAQRQDEIRQLRATAEQMEKR